VRADGGLRSGREGYCTPRERPGQAVASATARPGEEDAVSLDSRGTVRGLSWSGVRTHSSW